MDFYNRLAEIITDIGDSAVLGTIVIVTSGFFLFSKCPREAAAMALSFVIPATLISLLKITFLSCGQDFLDIQSPSGHAALSVSVFGTYALILSYGCKTWHSYILPLLILSLGFIIAVTRIGLKFHSITEVILGVTVGIGAIMAMKIFVLDTASQSGGRSYVRFNTYILIGLSIVAVALVHGTKLPAEKKIRAFAEYIKDFFPEC